jgi:predicted NBD/HSP70 family sugar kinase
VRRRIGIDVGGTNTDAVLLEDDVVAAAVKTPPDEPELAAHPRPRRRGHLAVSDSERAIVVLSVARVNINSSTRFSRRSPAAGTATPVQPQHHITKGQLEQARPILNTA